MDSLNSSCDPRQRLGSEVFIHIISLLESASDITAAEAVHSAWRDAILDRDRTLWLPQARKLGVREQKLSALGEQQVRAICRAHYITLDNKRYGRSVARDYLAASEHEESGPWRIKVDDVARVAYVTGRSDSFRIMSIDLDTDETLYTTSLGSGAPAYAHLEAADGYLMVTVGAGGGASFQLLRTSTAVDFEQKQGVSIKPIDIKPGNFVEHHLITPPTPCLASRMRSVPGSGPVLCTAGLEGAYFWDVQSGACLSSIPLPRSMRHDGYIEFNAEHLFLLTYTCHLWIFERTTGEYMLMRIAASGAKVYPLECTVQTGSAVSRLRCSTTRLEVGSPAVRRRLVPICIHDSEDDLVVTCRGGFIIIVLAYKELLEEKMTSGGPIGSLLEEPRVYCIQTNLNSMVLHVDQEYALLHSATGVYSLSLDPFRQGSCDSHHLRLLYSNLESSDLLGEDPSALQLTDDAVYFVHSLPTHRFVLCRLDFSPQPSQIL